MAPLGPSRKPQESLIKTDSKSSYLSSVKYGYDFVVATTEASINSNLRQFLTEESQPVQYICFLADPQTGNPSTQISLEELLVRINGVNPFEIPANTPDDDQRIGVLTEAFFVVRIKIQMGLLPPPPPRVPPKDLPPVVTLGGSATNVLFNLLCSDACRHSRLASIWFRRYKDKGLNTPYLNNHPDIQAQLRDALQNFSGTAFSLKQLLFDMDSAVLQTTPTFHGIPPGSNADTILQKSFVSIYAKHAKDHGLATRKCVSPLRDNNGVITNPTAAQRAATTLDYLCAVNNHRLPGPAVFDWNWVLPSDAGSTSGIIAINRNALTKFFRDQLIPLATPACIETTCSTPAALSLILNIPALGMTEQRQGLPTLKWRSKPIYTCDVTFEGDTITITQHLLIYIHVRWDNTQDDFNAYDITCVDKYGISVDQYGGLKLSDAGNQNCDLVEGVDVSAITNFFTGMGDLFNDIKDAVRNFASTEFKDFGVNTIQNFVFPGAQSVHL
ncbi:hypothetical protein VTO42DRAFT_1523 [Malbranchea cinnamomea]